ncbi:MAG: nickel pincer cofactor biosynthesis protein LarC [Bacillota bacterium]
MKSLYFDCFSGISGDMCLGALLDAGVPLGWLEQELGKLTVGGYKLQVGKVRVQGITATDVQVLVNEAQPMRHLSDILASLRESRLSPAVIEKASSVFLTLAHAEAKVHGSDINHVHFHEVGAVDAIVDVVGTIAGLEFLQIERVLSSPLPVTSGWVNTAHGRLPLPAPATAELMTGIPVYGSAVQAELVTPTGAALITTLASGFGPLPPATLVKTGYGAGKIQLPHPNLLRVFMIETSNLPGIKVDTVGVLETHIDDMNPELFGYIWKKAFSAGALDVVLTPAHMKKGRPGTVLTVVCPPEKCQEISYLIIAETTTTGIRVRLEQRFIANRWSGEVNTPWGPVKVKYSQVVDPHSGLAKTKAAPEYEDCVRLAESARISLLEIYEWANAATLQEAKPHGHQHQ